LRYATASRAGRRPHWVAIKVKTTDHERYTAKTDVGFEYLAEDVAYSQRGSLPVVILLVRLSDAPLFWKRHRPMALRTTSKLPCVDYAIFGLDEMTRILEGRRLNGATF
jgi:hypothetical protein